MYILYEIMLCLNFEIYNGVNVKQCNYLYNDDNMFVINPLYTSLIFDYLKLFLTNKDMIL